MSDTPLVTPSRDALAEALHDLACGCAEPGEHSYALADALLASGVVVPDVYLAGLAEDSRFCHRVAQRCGEGATKVFAAAAALATPTTEETGT